MKRKRKTEHIENYLKTEYIGETLFSDVILQHNSIPEIDFEEVSTETEFLGKKLSVPILVNSMTGGGDISHEINRDLADLASEYGLAMAVGSESIALEDEETKSSFTVVRDFLDKDNLLIGNLSARSSIDDIKKAVDLIEADAMQLHLNPAQELAMQEGDRTFKGIYDNIKLARENISVPLIIKEVGFGISPSVGKKLYDIGIRYIDVAGCGGTNFLEIEDLRRVETDFSDLYHWGTPTAALLEGYKGLYEDLNIISSGGVRTASDVVKSLIMGANLVGISGEILNYLLRGGKEYAKQYLEDLIYKIKMIMILVGAKDIKELKKVDYKIVGRLKDYK